MHRGRPPSAKTLVDRQLGRNVIHPVLPAGESYIIPNHSGDHSAGRVDRTPVNELDMVNKEYVDAKRNIRTETGNYTAVESDHIIICNATAGAITVTLGAASGLNRQIYHIKKTDVSGNAVTIDANSTETIDGALTNVLNTQYDNVMIVCDGSNWHII